MDMYILTVLLCIDTFNVEDAEMFVIDHVKVFSIGRVSQRAQNADRSCPQIGMQNSYLQHLTSKNDH